MSDTNKSRRPGPGRPPGRNFPCDIRVRLPENLRVRLVSLGEQRNISLSEIVRQALEVKFGLQIEQ